MGTTRRASEFARPDGRIAVSVCSWSINWGSLPDWLAAIGTVGSLGVVAIGLTREVKRRREDDRAAAAERRHATARQARLVTAVARAWSPQQVHVTVRNESQAPIFDVKPGLLVADPETGQQTVPLAGRVLDFVAMHRIAGGSGELQVALTVDEPLTADPRAITDLIFTDANGLRWRRINNGQPIPYDD